MNYYVGIDPSISNSGVVVLDHGGEIISAIEPTKEIKKLKHTKKILKHPILRYKTISEYIQDHLNDLWDASYLRHGITFIIGYEDYSFDSTNKSFTMGEFGGVLKVAIVDMAPLVQLYYVPPTTLKLFATGNGGATKEMMVAQYNNDHPKNTMDSHDLVDAYYLAEIAGYIDKEFPKKNNITPLTRHKLEVVKALGSPKPICNS